jgi:hypothetical protein
MPVRPEHDDTVDTEPLDAAEQRAAAPKPPDQQPRLPNGATRTGQRQTP